MFPFHYIVCVSVSLFPQMQLSGHNLFLEISVYPSNIILYFINFIGSDLCRLVVRVSGYGLEVPGSIPGAIRISEK
jgi:hypothetical protein